MCTHPTFSVTVKVDDEMVEHYCNEDTYVMHVNQDPANQQNRTMYTITLVDVVDHHQQSRNNNVSCIATTTSQI